MKVSRIWSINGSFFIFMGALALITKTSLSSELLTGCMILLFGLHCYLISDREESREINEKQLEFYPCCWGESPEVYECTSEDCTDHASCLAEFTKEIKKQ